MILHFDLSAILAIKFILDQFVGVFRDIDSPRFRIGFHPGSHIYRIAPNVIGKLFGPDHSGNYGPGVQSYSNVEWGDFLFHPAFGIIEKANEFERHFDDFHDMALIGLRNPACTHVGIPDGFDLLQSVSFYDLVKF